jgi:hypothetical protein
VNVMHTLALFNVDELVDAVLWCREEQKNVADHY